MRGAFTMPGPTFQNGYEACVLVIAREVERGPAGGIPDIDACASLEQESGNLNPSLTDGEQKRCES